MTKVYDFDWHRLQKEDVLRKSLGYSTEVWQLMKESGYNVNSVNDREQFFKDLEDLD